MIDKTPARATMFMNPFALIGSLVRVVQRLLRPIPSAVEVGIGAAGDLTRTRSELVVENPLLRQQVTVLRRSTRRPRVHHDDRLLLLILPRLCRRWWEALHIVNPETLLPWPRDLFKIIWMRKSRPRGQPKRLAPEVVTLIQTMARDNALWGAERIRGEFLKLGILVSKRTTRKYMRHVRPSGSRGQTWRTFIILSERQLRRVLKGYVEIYFNRDRPHQDLWQGIPVAGSRAVPKVGGKVLPIPILGGLHHDYQWAA